MSFTLNLKRFTKKKIQKLFRINDSYEFKIANSIKEQKISFSFHNRTFEIKSDGSTPLYETICEIVDYDCYELKQVDFSKFNKDSIALDIGGNIGTFSIVLSTLFPGKIICVEPVPQNCKLIEMNLKNNDIKNVEVLPAAICLKDEKLSFFQCAESVSGSLIAFEQASLSAFPVQGLSVASLLKKVPRVDFIKLDCEGSEYDIVPEFLEKAPHIQYFTGEIHKCGSSRGFSGKAKDVEILIKLLDEKGYSTSTKPEMFGRRGLTCMFAQK